MSASRKATRSRATGGGRGRRRAPAPAFPDTGHARNYASIALAYAQAAVADRRQVRHCKWVRLACRRHLEDLKRAKRKDWPFAFDPWHANDVCDFIEKLPHVKGRWESPTIELDPSQIFELTTVFGWRRKASGLRRFSQVYEEKGRKNAKSTKIAGVELYCLTCEDEPGAEVLCAATTFAQAWKVFEPAKLMVERTAAIQEAFGLTPWAKSITCADNGGYIQPIHSRSKSQDGWSPHMASLDEYHAHANSGLFDVLRSASGSRRQPLLWIITTAGFNVHGPCYERRTFATKVLEGIVTADHVFAIIFTLDGPKDFTPERKNGDDPFDEANWIKPNPLLGTAVNLEEMRQYAVEAKESPSAEGEFKTKRLNTWMGAAAAWLNVAQWNARADASLTLADFKGLDCYVGVDLADKDDLAAVVLAAIDAAGRLLVKPYFYLPEAALKRESQAEKDMVASYREWHAAGWLKTTEGDFIDHRRIKRRIRALKRSLMVRKVLGDEWSAFQTMAAELNEEFAAGDEDFALILPKNAKNFTDPAKDLEARVRAKAELLRHDGNPVMAWMIGNAVVTRGVNGSILPKKDKPMSPNKIDGVDGLVSAMAPMQVPAEDKKPSVDDYLAMAAQYA